jgi:hypothetical protein
MLALTQIARERVRTHDVTFYVIQRTVELLKCGGDPRLQGHSSLGRFPLAIPFSSPESLAGCDDLGAV